MVMIEKFVCYRRKKKCGRVKAWGRKTGLGLHLSREDGGTPRTTFTRLRRGSLERVGQRRYSTAESGLNTTTGGHAMSETDSCGHCAGDSQRRSMTRGMSDGENGNVEFQAGNC